MAGEIAFQLNYSDIKNTSSTYVSNTSKTFRDIKIKLCSQRHRSGDETKYSTGIRVILPEIVKVVRFSYKIVIYKGNDRSTLFDNHGNTTGYDDPSTSSAQYGLGPFNMSSSQITSSTIERKYLHNDGTLRFKVLIYNDNYRVDYDSNSMMRKIASFLEKQNPDLKLSEDTTDNIHQLQKMISHLEKENSRVNQESEKIQGILESKQQAVIDQEKQVISLAKANEDLKKENQQLIEQIAEVTKKMEILNSEVASCNFMDALAAMKPNKVRLGDCDQCFGAL